MNRDQMLEHIQNRAGLSSIDEARAAADAVLEAIGEGLAPVDGNAVARELPTDLASALLRGVDRDGSPSVEDLHHRVAKARRLALSEAAEEVVSVSQVLADAVSDEARAHLKAHQPEEWSALFDVVEDAEAPPGLGHDLFAQRDSLARSHNPHAANKLSSGFTAPAGEPLAEGRPGSETPLSERGHDDERS